LRLPPPLSGTRRPRLAAALSGTPSSSWRGSENVDGGRKVSRQIAGSSGMYSRLQMQRIFAGRG
jgi:hypothetical protein